MDAMDRVIDQLYDAACDAAAWPQAMTALCRLAGADHAIGMVQDPSKAHFPLVAAARVDPAHVTRFVDAAPWGIAQLQGFGPGRAFSFDTVVPREEFLRSDFFNDVIRPMGGYRALIAIPFRHDGYDSYLAVCRAAQAADFSERESAAIDRIVPHMTRAMRTRLTLDDAARRLAAALGAFDQLEAGIAIVDRELRPVVLNRRAERMIDGGDGLKRSRGGLQAGNPADQSWLRHLVRRAADDEPRVPGTYVMRLHRPAPLPPWSVTACRLPAGHSRAEARLVVLMIEDAARPAGDAAPALIALYGLSPREAALAAELANGADLAAAARALGVAIGTARNHLKAVFAKTGTHRQTELVTLLLRARRLRD